MLKKFFALAFTCVFSSAVIASSNFTHEENETIETVQSLMDELTPEQRAQLEADIAAALVSGASLEDVAADVFNNAPLRFKDNNKRRQALLIVGGTVAVIAAGGVAYWAWTKHKSNAVAPARLDEAPAAPADEVRSAAGSDSGASSSSTPSTPAPKTKAGRGRRAAAEVAPAAAPKAPAKKKRS